MIFLEIMLIHLHFRQLMQRLMLTNLRVVPEGQELNFAPGEEEVILLLMTITLLLH